MWNTFAFCIDSELCKMRLFWQATLLCFLLGCFLSRFLQGLVERLFNTYPQYLFGLIMSSPIFSSFWREKKTKFLFSVLQPSSFYWHLCFSPFKFSEVNNSKWFTNHFWCFLENCWLKSIPFTVLITSHISKYSVTCMLAWTALLLNLCYMHGCY